MHNKILYTIIPTRAIPTKRRRRKNNVVMLQCLSVITTILVAMSHHYHHHAAYAAFSLSFANPKTKTTLSILYNKKDQNENAKSQNDQDLVIQQLGYLPTNYVCVSARYSSNSNHPIAIQTYPLLGGSPRRQTKSAISINQKSITKNNNSIIRSEIMSNIETNDNDDNNILIQNPFPTVFWLTCPKLSTAIANLERVGKVVEYQNKLQQNPILQQQWMQCHLEYASFRWNSLQSNHQHVLSTLSSRRGMKHILQTSGISGSLITAKTTTTTTTTSNNDNNDTIIIPSTTTNIVPSVKCLHAHYAHYASCKHDPYKKLLPTINPVGEWIHEELVCKHGFEF